MADLPFWELSTTFRARLVDGKIVAGDFDGLR